jgi:hypothetical protein
VRSNRFVLVTLMALVAMNIWTGGPLLALWIGSRVQPSGQLSMLAVAVAAISLAVITYALVRLLARIDARYGEVSGRPTTVRRHVPWLRSMRGERPHVQRHANELSALEKILVGVVVLVVAVFEVWFFFYSGSPIDQRSGRNQTGVVLVRW